MKTLSAMGMKRRETLHPNIQQVLDKALADDLDITLLYGHRTPQEQYEIWCQGRTKPGAIVTHKDGIKDKSMHNYFPSLAMDIALFDSSSTPVDWKDLSRFFYLGGRIVQIARDLKIPMRWLGDADGDTNIKEEKFIDLPHFELIVLASELK